MKYTELIFRSRDPKKIFPDQARRIVAAACDGITMNPEIFNRTEDGKTISGYFGKPTAEERAVERAKSPQELEKLREEKRSRPEKIGIPPRIIFDGGAGFIRMYGVGNAGSQILDEETPRLFSALYKCGFIGFDRKEGEMKIERGFQDTLYSVRTMVVARHPKACGQFIHANLEGEVASVVQKLFIKGITGVAKMLDQESESKKPNELLEYAVPREVSFIEAKPLAIQIKPGLLGSAYKDIVLSMPCKLSGPWSTGMLRSRGYGLIRRFTPKGSEA